MNETPYRESAEMPAEPAEPVWPKIWAALKRLGLILLVSAGPAASVCLWRLGDVAILLDFSSLRFRRDRAHRRQVGQNTILRPEQLVREALLV